jgi:hypothetical protein
MDNSTQGWWLDTLGLALVLLGVNALGLCWLRRFLRPLLLTAYHKYTHKRHQHKCNAWDAKSGKKPNHAESIHVNPYKLFTNLPLTFLVF